MTDYIKVSSLWRLLACDYETQFPPGGAIGDWEYNARVGWEERWRLRPVTRWPSSGWEQTITFRPHKSYPRCGPGLGLNYIICCRKCQTQRPQKSNKNNYFFSCEDAAQQVLMCSVCLSVCLCVCLSVCKLNFTKSDQVRSSQIKLDQVRSS